jgi:hypothetical protein
MKMHKLQPGCHATVPEASLSPHETRPGVQCGMDKSGQNAAPVTRGVTAKQPGHTRPECSSVLSGPNRKWEGDPHCHRCHVGDSGVPPPALAQTAKVAMRRVGSLSPNTAVQPPVPTASPLVRKGRKGNASIQRVGPGELGEGIRKISREQPRRPDKCWRVIAVLAVKFRAQMAEQHRRQGGSGAEGMPRCSRVRTEGWRQGESGGEGGK